MTPLHIAAITAEGAAAIACIALAFRRREHVPAAVALSLLTVVDGARAATSVAPSLTHLDRALMLGAAVIVPGLAVAVFLRPRLRRPALTCIGGAWVVACVLLAVFYPPPAPVALQRFYLAVDLGGLVVSIASLVTWGWWARGHTSPNSAHAVAMSLIALDLALLLTPQSPWRNSIFVASFDVMQGVVLIFFAVVAFVEVALWMFSKPS